MQLGTFSQLVMIDIILHLYELENNTTVLPILQGLIYAPQKNLCGHYHCHTLFAC
jgi:hypothetical protein